MLLRTFLLFGTSVPALLLAQQSVPQPTLRLKSRIIAVTAEPTQLQLALPAQGRVHRIIQFTAAPTSDVVGALTAQGIAVVGAVPVNGLLVTLDSDHMQAAFPGLALADISSVLSDTLTGLGVQYVAPVDPFPAIRSAR